MQDGMTLEQFAAELRELLQNAVNDGLDRDDVAALAEHIIAEPWGDKD